MSAFLTGISHMESKPLRQPLEPSHLRPLGARLCLLLSSCLPVTARVDGAHAPLPSPRSQLALLSLSGSLARCSLTPPRAVELLQRHQRKPSPDGSLFPKFQVHTCLHHRIHHSALWLNTYMRHFLSVRQCVDGKECKRTGLSIKLTALYCIFLCVK